MCLVEIAFCGIILLSLNVNCIESEAVRKLLRTVCPMKLDDHLLESPLHMPKLYDRASPREAFHRSLRFAKIYLELSNAIYGQLVTTDE